MVLEHQGLRVAVLTRRGSGRDINQDRVVVNDTVVDSDRRTTIMFALGCPSVVAVLARLGGHPAGEIAAALAAEVMAQGSFEVKTEQDVVSLVVGANQFLYDATLPSSGRILAATDGLFGRTNPSTLSKAMKGPLENVPDQLSDVASRSGNTD